MRLRFPLAFIPINSVMNKVFIRGTILPFLALFGSFSLYAQELRIGQQVSDLLLNNVINYKSSSLNLSDFKGKALIIDFWNTRCAACLKLFPKIDSLQWLFKNDLQIILVNQESQEYTIEFFKKHKKISIPDVPMITNDKKLMSLFPAEGYPYTVWIDTNMTVQYFAGGQNLTQKNIGNFLNEEKQFFRDPTLVKHGSIINENKFEYFSFISRCYDSLDIGNTEKTVVKNENAVFISSNCSSIIELYKRAFREYDKYNFDTKYSIVLHRIDSSKYLYPTDPQVIDKWLKDYSYNYQLLLPISKSDSAYRIMQADLKRYFGLSVQVEKRTIKGLILVKTGDSLLVRDGRKKNEFQKGRILASKDSLNHFKNRPFQDFVNWLRPWVEYSFPFCDQTGYKDSASITIRNSSISPLNIHDLKNDLRSSGFDLIEGMIDVDVLCISEN